MFHSRGDRDLGVAFQTHPGSQASSQGKQRTPLGTPLSLVQWKRASSLVEAGTSGFLSISDSDRSQGRLSYLSLLFFGSLHSNAYIFPFLVSFLLLFFSRLFVRPPRQPFCLFAFLFLEDGFDPSLLYNVTNLCP